MERLLLCAVRENLIPATLDPHKITLLSPSGQAILQVPVQSWYTLKRFDLASWPTLAESQQKVTSIDALMACLHPQLDTQTIKRLTSELSQSLQTMSSSLDAQAQHGLGVPGHGSLADWEARIWLGHPLHPVARRRTGMSSADSRRFGAEWLVKFKLPLLEVPHEDLIIEGDFLARMAQLFPSSFQGSKNALIPIHPWAKEVDLPQRFAQYFQSKRWRWSPAPALDARPSLSLRTVILEGSSCLLHLKLPLAVETTGALRTISAAAAHNGPLLSALLHQLWCAPPVQTLGILKNLSLMSETASFRLADDHQGQARYLAGILRELSATDIAESPCHDVAHRYLTSQSIPGPPQAPPSDLAQEPRSQSLLKHWLVPAAALLEPRENPLFLRVAAHLKHTPFELWQEYVKTLLPPLAFLTGQLGIAFEAHLQNIVVAFPPATSNKPQLHFLYRDLGGIRIQPSRLRQGIHAWALTLQPFKLDPGSAICTESSQELTSKFLYSTLQNHLGELLRAIIRVERSSEAPYWAVVRDVLKDNRSFLGTDLLARVFNRTWDLKAMWSMRVQQAITEYTFVPVPNPWTLKP